VMIVVGAPNSSNSQRLVETARRAGASRAFLVQSADEIDFSAFGAAKVVGVTAGASAPEVLVEAVIDAFRRHFDVTVEAVTTRTENVSFKLPRALRDDSAPTRLPA
jgi:4-hydroxy-3-methylbut-2-enyl diphosphate reductase